MTIPFRRPRTSHPRRTAKHGGAACRRAATGDPLSQRRAQRACRSSCEPRHTIPPDKYAGARIRRNSMNLPGWAAAHGVKFEPYWELGSNLFRVGLAAFSAAQSGLERELKHKPAGLRTNMFICLGAAMFTILSAELAGEFTRRSHARGGTDHPRHRVHRRRIDPAFPRIGAGHHDGGDLVCRRFSRHGRGRRTVPDCGARPILIMLSLIFWRAGNQVQPEADADACMRFLARMRTN